MHSMPRLMAGAGGDHRRGHHRLPGRNIRARAAEMRAALGISKVMTVTCTYDHRIIQGAESGMFLGTLQALLKARTDSTRRSSSI